MLFYTEGQASAFLVMLYCGMGIGIWYGLCDLLSRSLCAGYVLRAVTDILFALLSAPILCAGLLLAGYGEMRLYCFLGALCGFTLYQLTLARAINWGIRRVARMLKRFVKPKDQKNLSNRQESSGAC